MEVVMKDMMQRKRELKIKRNSVLDELQEKVIRTVKMGDDEYHTLDDWSSEPQLDAADDDGDKDDIWGDEKTLQFSNVPQSFGRILRSKLFQDNLNLGLTDLQMTLRFNVCLAWEFCKSVVSLKVR